ncbi:MAG TPA: helix-turn-helix transcriptional regulator, partial [Opitutaceae bacterium]|nr:helix-turn-helix transcriptional regulator [Opitutaceae bacterium]
ARQRERVGRVTAHMQAHLGETIDHGRLERVSGLSPSRLQAVFREVTGYPPLDYLRRLRVEAARRLLADARLAVKEIAARTGFRDTSHFSKVFRRIDGLSPAHYREALLAGGRAKQEK